MNLVQKIEEWLEDEIETYKEYEDDIGGSGSFDDGILEGRHECAENLLDKIKEWKKEWGISV